MSKRRFLSSVAVLVLATSVRAQDNLALGKDALASNQSGTQNTALGIQALKSNTTGSYNTGVGFLALSANETGIGNVGLGTQALSENTSGGANTAIGCLALRANTTGGSNIAIGYSSLYQNQSGYSNIAIGANALFLNSTGCRNTAIGEEALAWNGTGQENVAVGGMALDSNVDGNFNTAVGATALQYNASGQYNIAIGHGAGVSVTTGSYNIHMGHPGQVDDARTIRIGQSGGYHTRTYIAGIRGVTTGFRGAIPVVIDANGQLGTLFSSIRYKQDVNDMGDSTSRLFDLRPVTFRYKSQPEGGLHFGLIAEEVEKVLPELVVRDQDGQVETVAYHELAPMLLNEAQKQKRELQLARVEGDALKAKVADLEVKDAALSGEVAKLKRQVELLLERLSR